MKTICRIESVSISYRQPAVNRLVAGSSPARGANRTKALGREWPSALGRCKRSVAARLSWRRSFLHPRRGSTLRSPERYDEARAIAGRPATYLLSTPGGTCVQVCVLPRPIATASDDLSLDTKQAALLAGPSGNQPKPAPTDRRPARDGEFHRSAHQTCLAACRQPSRGLADRACDHFGIRDAERAPPTLGFWRGRPEARPPAADAAREVSSAPRPASARSARNRSRHRDRARSGRARGRHGRR